MKLSKRLIAAALLIVGSSGAVYAFGKHNHWGMTPDEKVEFVTERVTSKLDLDSEQQRNFTELATTVAQIMQEARIEKAQNLTEIEALLEEPSFNQARALELIQQKTSMVNEKAPLVIASLAVFLDSLSVEQKSQMKEFLQHRHKHHRHGNSN